MVLQNDIGRSFLDLTLANIGIAGAKGILLMNGLINSGILLFLGAMSKMSSFVVCQKTPRE